MIEVVCLNPAMDRTLYATHLQVGGVNRAERVVVMPGGKGLNVARFLKTLDPGTAVRITGFAGGHVGQFIIDGCYEQGIDAGFVRIADATRVCMIMVDGDCFTVMNEPGPQVTRDELNSFRQLSGTPQLALISGSAPHGIPDSFYKELVETYRERGVSVFVDASGRLLAEAVLAGPTLLKINEFEFAQLVGSTSPLSQNDLLAQSKQFFTYGTRAVIVTMGERGSLVVTPSEVAHIDSLPVAAANTVACGDAYFAGLALGFIQGLSSIQAAVYATAAAALKAENFAPVISAPLQFKEYCSRVVSKTYRHHQ